MCDRISVVSHCKQLLYTSLELILKLVASFLNTVFKTSLVSSFLFWHLHPVSDGSHLQASSSGEKTSWSLLLSGIVPELFRCCYCGCNGTQKQSEASLPTISTCLTTVQVMSRCGQSCGTPLHTAF